MSQPGVPAGGFGRPALPKHPQSQLAMILGIVSVAGMFACLLPILISPVAWYLGLKAKREIEAEPQRWSGASEANAGMVLGIIGSALMVLGVLLIIGLIALIAIGSGASTY